jgi:hypothetical protein
VFERWRGIPRRKEPLSQHLYRRFLHKYFVRDVNFELQLMARREAALYIRRHMPGATMYADRWELLEAAVLAAPADGLFVELGVEKGRSANFVARLLAARGAPAELHAFDSFEGLPENWHGTFERRGKFGMRGAMPKVDPNVRLYPGWFDATLPGFRTAAEGRRIAFLHVDCDLYSSTAAALGVIGDLLAPGSIVVFDEYLNYHGWRQHEFRAWQEWVAAHGVKYRYSGFCARGGQVSLAVETVAGQPQGR